MSALPFAGWREDLYDDWWPKWSRPYGRAWSRKDAVERQLWVLHVKPGDSDDGGQSDMTNKRKKKRNRLVVFLIHGGGGRAEQFREVAQRLLGKDKAPSWSTLLDDTDDDDKKDVNQADEDVDIELVIPNLLGHGRSAKPMDEGAYETMEHVADMEALIDEFGCRDPEQGRNVIIGHSFGTVLTQHVVARGRINVTIDRIALLGTCCEVPAASKSPLLHCCLCFFECIRPLLSKASAKSMFYDFPLVDRESRVVSQNPLVAVIGLARQLRWTSPTEYARVRIPTLIINGALDAVTPTAGAAALHKAIAGSSFDVVDQCRHNVHMERGDVVATAILQWLNKK
eukprot:TRINITY_DN40766_c0_g1_i1.p1 TRINITY_DN40766_c0_g1~~TRINITY_DN40766_c0_g1_i1.p1  ORF type:complete len:341 (+),score=138.48 TRINITY_DN40766_c0_g1_i1:68-1090(+)